MRNHKSIKVTTVYLKRDEMRPIKGVIQSLSDFKPCRKHTSKLCHMAFGSTTNLLRYDSVWLRHEMLYALILDHELLLYLDTVPSIIWLPEYLRETDDFDCGEIYVAIKPTEEVIKVLSICNGPFVIPLALTLLPCYCKSDTNWGFYWTSI